MNQNSMTTAIRLPLGLPEGWAERLLQLDRVREVWRRAMDRRVGSIHERVIDELELRLEALGDLDSVPRQGPLVVVANHPFGIVEGPTLGALLERVRPDVKFVTNSLLAELPELRERIFAVNAFGGAAHENTAAVRGALRHLREGGALVVFPAGEVSAMRAPLGFVSDPAWQPMAARLAMKTSAKVLPVFFAGGNRAQFQLAGLLHPSLRTMLLASEMLARRKQTIRVVVGQPLEAAKFRDAEGFTDHLRGCTYALAKRIRQAPVAAATAPSTLSAEVAGLTPVLEAGDYRVYLEPAHRIPVALPEIGRLRELTFRSAGEGTGAARDLDEFDPHYWHLFVWHEPSREIAGAYRLADGAQLRGKMYCRTLFHFPKRWEQQISAHGAELGRSFVRVAYQRDFLPLLLLWKGIGRFVLDRPHLRYLYGPVSISADYTPAARAVIAGYFRKWRAGVRPRNPLTLALAWWPGARLNTPAKDLDTLSKHVAELEPDGKGLPVLLRQYANLGGEILCMNVDPRFGNTLDGLVLVDLHHVPPRMMQRYFGSEGVQRFSGSQPEAATVAAQATVAASADGAGSRESARRIASSASPAA